MTPPEGNEAPRSPSLMQVGAVSLLAALLGGVLAVGISEAIKAPDDDPDRPPIIVRNGSVEVVEDLSAIRGQFVKQAGRSWYHDHPFKGPNKLTAYVVGVANSSCGTGFSYTRYNVHKLEVTYEVDGKSKRIDIKLNANRVEIDIDNNTGVPDPDAGGDAWVKTFDRPGVLMTQVVLSGGGPPATCTLDPSKKTQITVYQRQ